MRKHFLIFFILSTFIITGCNNKNADISGCYETSNPAKVCKDNKCCQEKLDNTRAWYQEKTNACRARTCILKVEGPPIHDYSAFPGNIHSQGHSAELYGTPGNNGTNNGMPMIKIGNIHSQGHSAELYGTQGNNGTNNETLMMKIGNNWYSIDSTLPKGSYVKVEDSWYKLE